MDQRKHGRTKGWHTHSKWNTDKNVITVLIRMNSMHGAWRMKLKGGKYLNAIIKQSMSREMFPHMHNVGCKQQQGSECISEEFTNRRERGNRQGTEYIRPCGIITVIIGKVNNMTSSLKPTWDHCHHSQGQWKGQFERRRYRKRVKLSIRGTSTCSSRMACSFFDLLCR